MSWTYAGRNYLSVLVLVASDVSYKRETAETIFNPDGSTHPGEPLAPYPDSNPDVGFPLDLAQSAGVTLSNWIADFRFNDPATGFGVTVFKNATTKEYVVALEGTDGPNGQDWYNNLNYGTLQWTEGNKNALFAYLLNAQRVPSNASVLFTGQSLGGALAQFAVYDYAKRKNELNGQDPTLPAFDPSKVSLITYNSLGGVGGLKLLNAGAYDTGLLAGTNTAHYVTANDFVSRLGVGHVNGASNTYLLDFKAAVGTTRLPDAVSAHRIESGFYDGFATFGGDFGSQAQAGYVIPYLSPTVAQAVGAAFANLFNDSSQSEAESWARLAAGLIYAGGVVPTAELSAFVSAVVDHIRLASDESNHPRWIGMKQTLPILLRRSDLAARSGERDSLPRGSQLDGCRTSCSGRCAIRNRQGKSAARRQRRPRRYRQRAGGRADALFAGRGLSAANLRRGSALWYLEHGVDRCLDRCRSVHCRSAANTGLAEESRALDGGCTFRSCVARPGFEEGR